MNYSRHIWRMAGRKMAGESSPEELEELRVLVQNDQQLQSLIAAFDELWRSTEMQDAEQIEQAWQRHVQRLQTKTGDSPEPPDAHTLKTPTHPSPP